MSQPSKFKNALGYEKKEKYTNCAVSTVSTEGRLIAVNCNFLAMSWNNAGEIVVVDSSKQISVNPKQARIKGHRASSLDLEFSPFSSDLLAAAFDDGAVLLYKIPEGGITENITQEVQLYNNHTKKVPFVTFNPIASDVVCSAAFNGEIHVWSAIQGDTICQVNAEDTPTSLSWSPNGVLIGATTKNKFVHIFDPRNNNEIMKQQINEGFQSAKMAWIDNDTFVTTSWNKAGMKILKLWDIRKVNPDLTSSEVTSVQIDTSKTVSTPFVDRESKLVYTIGKGEAYIHYYDYSEGKFVKGIDYKATEPSISSVMFERKCLDYNKNEIDRFARYVNSQKVYYISFNIARRNPGFDQSLYPPVEYGEAALTVEQWKGGETAEPLKKEINTIENKFVSKVESFVKQEPKTVQKKSDDKVKELEGKLAELSVKYNQLELENEKLKKELQQLE
jgi:WD40 repeat protein